MTNSNATAKRNPVEILRNIQSSVRWVEVEVKMVETKYLVADPSDLLASIDDLMISIDGLQTVPSSIPGSLAMGEILKRKRTLESLSQIIRSEAVRPALTARAVDAVVDQIQRIYAFACQAEDQIVDPDARVEDEIDRAENDAWVEETISWRKMDRGTIKSVDGRFLILKGEHGYALKDRVVTADGTLSTDGWTWNPLGSFRTVGECKARAELRTKEIAE